MKKLFIVILGTIILAGCRKEQDFLPMTEVSEGLKISNSIGIKLLSPFVTSEVEMNVKSEIEGAVTIKIFDISNRVVSKETSRWR